MLGNLTCVKPYTICGMFYKQFSIITAFCCFLFLSCWLENLFVRKLFIRLYALHWVRWLSPYLSVSLFLNLPLLSGSTLWKVLRCVKRPVNSFPIGIVRCWQSLSIRTLSEKRYKFANGKTF